MTTAQLVKELDLNSYIWRSKWHKEPGLWGREQGLKASKEFGMTKLEGQPLLLKVANGINADESFIKALLGPLARKVGPHNLSRDLTIEGGFDPNRDSDTLGHYMRGMGLKMKIQEYLCSEQGRVNKRKEEKEKEAKGPSWSPRTKFYVPEIGTRLRLQCDWEFRLYTESRNDALVKQLNIPINRNWRYDNGGVSEQDVKMCAGALLTVSRVYIRQGIKDYSSLTFYVKKGAEVCRNGKVHTLKKGARFWAKLSDVNKMMVQIDTETLAEN